jgi:Zn-dependent protease with chaperone function
MPRSPGPRGPAHTWAILIQIALGVALGVAVAGAAAVPDTPPAERAGASAESIVVLPDSLIGAHPDSTTADSLAARLTSARRDYIAEVRAGFTTDNRAYSGTRTVLALFGPFYDLIIALLILFSGLSAAMGNIARGLGRRLYVQVLVFLILYTVVDFMLGFPLACYRGYALEHQYGLSNQGFAAWLGEQGKDAAVGVVVFGLVPILWLAWSAIRRWPRHWWLPVAAGTLPLIVAGTLLQPLVIDPLYNTFTPLRDQHLKARILDLAARAEIPGRNVYQVNKSAQTVKYNAYVSGFGPSQRIVLWDTMLQGMEEDEILFVMGHEMGHYRLGHIWKGIALFSSLSFAFFFLISRLAAWAVARFGDHWGFTDLADVAAMPLFAAVVVVLTLVAQPTVNAFSRTIEHESDVFAVEVTRDNDAGARAFLKLGSQNRSNPEPSAFVKLFLYTHPPLIERMRFALEYRPWEQGKANRFYKGTPAARRTVPGEAAKGP